MIQEDWTQQLREKLEDHQERVPDDLWAGIESQLDAPTVRLRPSTSWRRWVAAAAAVVLLAGGSLVIWNETKQSETEQLSANTPVSSSQGGSAISTQPTESDATPRIIQPRQSGPVLAQISEHEAPAGENLSETVSTGTVAEVPTVHDEAHVLQEKESLAQANPLATQESGAVSRNEPSASHAEKNTSVSSISGEKSVARPVRQSHELQMPVEKNAHERTLLTAALFASNGFDNPSDINLVQMSREMAQKFMSLSSARDSKAAPPIWLADYEEQQHHDHPVSFGIQVGYPLSNRLSVNTGVVYTKLNSQFAKVMKGHKVEQQQELHYVGVPLSLQYRLVQWGHLSVYASAGGQADWNVSAKMRVSDTRVDIDKDRCQWSLGGSLGLSYHLTPQVGIYAEPGFKYYLDNHSGVQNYFKDKPTSISLQLGLKFNIGEKK